MKVGGKCLDIAFRGPSTAHRRALSMAIKFFGDRRFRQKLQTFLLDRLGFCTAHPAKRLDREIQSHGTI